MTVSPRPKPAARRRHSSRGPRCCSAVFDPVAEFERISPAMKTTAALCLRTGIRPFDLREPAFSRLDAWAQRVESSPSTVRKSLQTAAERLTCE
jgi:hypothetical protein